MDIDEKVHVFEKFNLDGYCNVFQFINNSRRKT
jgi:type IV secretory pathway TraG/TraD family ATPase VirD4